MTNLSIPICPITQLPIDTPVIDPEGNTYEEYAIVQWLNIKQVSPITKNPLKISDLVKNRAIANIIETMKNLEIKTTENHETNIIKSCSDCGKDIKISLLYKGNQLPKCFNCRTWNCSACTFKNNNNLKKCEMCDTPK